MSADSFHHLDGKSMKKMKTIYDFVNAVGKANTRTVVKPMEIPEFHEWRDGHSVQRTNNGKVNNPKPYLAEMVQHLATRKSTNLEYKTSFDGATYKLDYLTKKFLQNMHKPVDKLQEPCGVSRNDNVHLYSLHALISQKC